MSYMTYKQEMVKRLKEDCKTLIDVKIPKALGNINDERGVNTYRNLTKALADNIKIIEEYDDKCEAMWAVKKDENDDSKSVVSIFMINSKGENVGGYSFDVDYKLVDEDGEMKFIKNSK